VSVAPIGCLETIGVQPIQHFPGLVQPPGLDQVGCRVGLASDDVTGGQAAQPRAVFAGRRQHVPDPIEQGRRLRQLAHLAQTVGGAASAGVSSPGAGPEQLEKDLLNQVLRLMAVPDPAPHGGEQPLLVAVDEDVETA